MTEEKREQINKLARTIESVEKTMEQVNSDSFKISVGLMANSHNTSITKFLTLYLTPADRKFILHRARLQVQKRLTELKSEYDSL